MSWYNPYVQWRTNDIWPNQETSIRAQNETTDILVMNYEPLIKQTQVPKRYSNGQELSQHRILGITSKTQN